VNTTAPRPDAVENSRVVAAIKLACAAGTDEAVGAVTQRPWGAGSAAATDMSQALNDVPSKANSADSRTVTDWSAGTSVLSKIRSVAWGCGALSRQPAGSVCAVALNTQTNMKAAVAIRCLRMEINVSGAAQIEAQACR
jgi:hypothetical protein